MRTVQALSILGAVCVALLAGCGGNPDVGGDTVRSDSSPPSASAGSSSTSSTGTSGETSGEGRPDQMSGQFQPLTAAQRQRLGPALRRLLTGDTLSRPSGPRATDPVGEREGREVYSILVEGADAKTLRDAGLPVTSAVAGTLTARLTLPEIRKAASLQNVRRVRLSGQATSR
jgi:hypothetical protein